MSLNPNLTIAMGVNDRVLPLMAGLVEMQGVSPRFITAPLEEIFANAFDHQPYDISELSCSNFIYLTTQGSCPYVGLPVFPSRSYRHGAFYIRTDRGITKPQDLKGKRVGVREYSMTAALVARGVLEDEYDVKAQDIDWYMGAADHTDTTPIKRMHPAGISLQSIDAEQNLSEMLEEGSLDALLAYKPPLVFVQGHPLIKRLFDDVMEAERDYAVRSNMFPIMHVMGIRQPWYAQHHDKILPILNGFEAARAYSFAKLSEQQALYSMHPWGVHAWRESLELWGADKWQYGFEENYAELEALCRYAFNQGIISKAITPETLFPADIRAWTPALNH